MHTAPWSLIPVSTSASVHLSGDVTRNRSRILFSLVGCQSVTELDESLINLCSIARCVLDGDIFTPYDSREVEIPSKDELCCSIAILDTQQC